MSPFRILACSVAFVSCSIAAHAQSTPPNVDDGGKAASAAPAAPTHEASSGAPAPLVVLFDLGSSTLRAKDKEVLDKASRAYSEGHPIVMILTGSTDRTGNAQANLSLSEKRAVAVLKGLLDRGLPADRFQVVAKGETDPKVLTSNGVEELQNRRVEITWR